MMTRRITGGLTLAFALLTVAGGLAYARRVGLVSPDLTVRGAMAASGVLVAFYGNDIPKIIRGASPGAHAIRRFAGWAFVLAGLAYAAIWAFAPLDRAADISMVELGSALAAVVVYGAWIRSRPTRA